MEQEADLLDHLDRRVGVVDGGGQGDDGDVDEGRQAVLEAVPDLAGPRHVDRFRNPALRPQGGVGVAGDDPSDRRAGNDGPAERPFDVRHRVDAPDCGEDGIDVDVGEMTGPGGRKVDCVGGPLRDRRRFGPSAVALKRTRRFVYRLDHPGDRAVGAHPPDE